VCMRYLASSIVRSPRRSSFQVFASHCRKEESVGEGKKKTQEEWIFICTLSSCLKSPAE
jgi:hypothetical protein